MPPLHVSDCGWDRDEGFVTGGRPCERQSWEDREDKERNRDQNISVCRDWVILDRTVSTLYRESQNEAGREEGFCVRVCVCTVQVVCIFAYVNACNTL